MKKVLLATEKPFAAEAVADMEAIFKKAGYEFIKLESYDSVDLLIKSLQGIDALIVRSDKITATIMEAAADLKIVVRGGAGFDNVDCAAATKQDITVMNTPGVNANAVAELAMGMAVYMARNLFTPKAGSELLGKSLGIHAYGNVGKNVARIAKGFGMDVYAFDPFVKKEVIEAEGIKVVDTAEDLYKTCQYVSLHLPSNKHTNKSINKELMSLMPKGATLLNTARKEVICEDSLKTILKERSDFKYVSDVAPDCAEEISAQYKDRVFFTPKKMGAQTGEANRNAAVAAAQQIVNFFENGDVSFKVN